MGLTSKKYEKEFRWELRDCQSWEDEAGHAYNTAVRTLVSIGYSVMRSPEVQLIPQNNHVLLSGSIFETPSRKLSYGHLGVVRVWYSTQYETFSVDVYIPKLQKSEYEKVSGAFDGINGLSRRY